MEICPHCIAAGVSTSVLGWAYYKTYLKAHWARFQNWRNK